MNEGKVIGGSSRGRGRLTPAMTARGHRPRHEEDYPGPGLQPAHQHQDPAVAHCGPSYSKNAIDWGAPGSAPPKPVALIDAAVDELARR